MKARQTVEKYLPETEQFKPGDKVSFVGKRGQQVTGTVARLRTRERRAASRFLAARGIHDPTLTSTDVAEVTPDGGGGVWTVPLRMLKMVKPGGGDANAALRTAQELKANYADQLRQRRFQRSQTADQGGLYDLKPGDRVKCQFRGGSWMERKFRRITPAGKVEVENDYGRVEKHNPQFVKKADS